MTTRYKIDGMGLKVDKAAKVAKPKPKAPEKTEGEKAPGTDAKTPGEKSPGK